ncbi:MAG TPA: molybdopterin-dependent oxidoreductase [Solirubrobacteraceae bacterium]|nr:molybdopterin-dependent oxidoreductase [Solirubrobacteraceae bacterium]
MTARVTDWGLAGLVAALLVTGALTLLAGSPGAAWIIAVHDACGFAIAVLVVIKIRRVWPRLVRAARGIHAAGIGAGLAIVGCFLAGFLWSGGVAVAPAGYSLLSWHDALGAILAIVVAIHMVVRAKRLRRRDLAGRRQFLAAIGLGACAVVGWRVQRPVEALLALKGARRRFTGSYEAGSFAGNAFPSTSWVADNPAAIDPASYRLRVEGLVAHPIAISLDELSAADELVATLDCTGGFYSTQRWRGVRLGTLLDLAGPYSGARHVTVGSITGYRWSFAIGDARGLLLATHVTGAPLSHDHGAPVRLVAPGARGFQWVKWVTRVEVRRDPDLAAPLSTIWSSFT